MYFKPACKDDSQLTQEWAWPLLPYPSLGLLSLMMEKGHKECSEPNGKGW